MITIDGANYEYGMCWCRAGVGAAHRCLLWSTGRALIPDRLLLQRKYCKVSDEAQRIYFSIEENGFSESI